MMRDVAVYQSTTREVKGETKDNAYKVYKVIKFVKSIKFLKFLKAIYCLQSIVNSHMFAPKDPCLAPPREARGYSETK